jgi:hypothetical protein
MVKDYPDNIKLPLTRNQATELEYILSMYAGRGGAFENRAITLRTHLRKQGKK